MKALRIVGIVVAAGLAGLGYYLYGGSSVPAGQDPLVRIAGADFREFRDSFNAAKDSVRVVTLLSPT